jgi:hypothetical protein
MNKLLIPLLCFALAGCATQPKSSGGPSSQTVLLSALTDGYVVPAEPKLCSRNADRLVHETIGGMYLGAVERGFTVDGTHAYKGALIFSEQGITGPIVVLISVFRNPSTGQIVFEDVADYKLSDQKQAARFQNEVIVFLRNPPKKA